MLNNASIQLIRSSSKMSSTLATRSLCVRSMRAAVTGCQRTSLITQIDLSRLSFQSSVRNYSTTLPLAREFDYRNDRHRPKFGRKRDSRYRDSNDRDSISRDKFVQVEEIDESHLDMPFEAGSKEANPITNEYTSLMPYITSNTFRALTADPFNFKEMSEVQQRVLSLLPELANPFNDSPMPDNQGGRDLLVKAKTGTGKTIAFLTPAIERRLRASRQVLEGKFTGPFKKILAQEKPDVLESTDLDQNTLKSLQRSFNASTAGVLVLSPTRELATQIAVEAEKLTKHNRNLNVQLLVGGASRVNQIRQWSRSRPDIVVATPGRLMDLLNEEKLISKALSAVQTLIYDEADTLLDMGFRDDIEKILRFLPKKEDRCTMLFSATVSSDIREIARKSLASDHRFIDCVPAGESNVHEHIPQFATLVRDGKEQLEQMTRLIAIDQLTNAGNSKIVVFAPTTKMVALYTSLFQDRQGLLDGLPAGKNTSVYELHSKKDSSQRFRISSSFRNDKSGASILFTSDVSARGVDYPGTTRVINLGISGTTDQYIHRIGRTGRAGAQGRADIILQRFEAGFLDTSLRKLPIKVEKIEDTKTQLAKLCQDFDENPESVVSLEIMDRMNAFSDRTSNNSRMGNNRNSTEKRITPAAKFLTPLSERLSDESIKAKVEMTKSSTSPAEVEDVFMSNLGFYISKAKEMGTNPDAVIDGMKEWAMSISDLPREPYVSPAMLTKMGVGASRKHSNRSGNSSRFGGMSSGRGRFDGGQSYGRGRFDGGNERRNNFDGYSRGGRSSNDRRSAERFF